MGTRTHRGLSTRDHNYLAVRSTWILSDTTMRGRACICIWRRLDENEAVGCEATHVVFAATDNDR